MTTAFGFNNSQGRTDQKVAVPPGPFAVLESLQIIDTFVVNNLNIAGMPKHITEDSKQGIVTINERKISGWISDDARCSTCGASRIYYDDFDAFFCPECNAWLEGVCGDRDCLYCKSRPDTPLPIENVIGP